MQQGRMSDSQLISLSILILVKALATGPVLYGKALPKDPTPYPFVYHFDSKSTPFLYLLLKKRSPFTYMYLLLKEHCIPLHTMGEHQALPEEILTKKQVSFIQFLFMLHLNDRFFEPFIKLNLRTPYPFI